MARPTPRLALILAALCLPASPAGAAPVSQPVRYFTHFGDTVLGQTDAVLLGRIESAQSLRGGEAVRVTVLTAFKGVEEPEVTLFAGRGEFFPGSEQLLFLVRYGEGKRYRFINRISRTDPEYDAKEECLRQQLTLETMAGEEERKNAVRRLLFENALASVEWTRWNMLREVAYVRKNYPGLLDETDRDTLRELTHKSPDQKFRQQLHKLLQDWPVEDS